MKIKTIKRLSFFILLLLPIILAVMSTLWTLGDKSLSLSSSDYSLVFLENFKGSLPDNAVTSYVGSALNDLTSLLVGSSEYDAYFVPYLAYGINLFLLWLVVDCFVALPLVLKRFIDRGIYRE